MAVVQGIERKVTITACGAAMNYQEANLPDSFDRTFLISYVYLVQALKPNILANVVLTAITTLRITPQIDFDSFFIIIVDLKF